MIRGIASSPTLQLDKLLLLPEGLVLKLPIPLWFEHARVRKGLPSDDLEQLSIGEVVGLRKSSRYVTAEAIFYETAAADFAWSFVTSGEVRAFSVGTNDLHTAGVVDGHRFVDRWEIRELSIGRAGMDPHATFSIVHNCDIDFF
jgi:hypothetical protein